MEKLSIIYNHSDILPSTTTIYYEYILMIAIDVLAFKLITTYIAIISIYIPVELAFDATLIESKDLFVKIKKGKFEIFLE